VKSVGGVATPGRTLQLNLGATALGSVGWGFGNGLRAEFEFDYRYNGFKSVSGPFGGGTVTGSEQKFGPMVNMLYDFNDLTPLFVPYIGVGAGYQWADDRTGTSSSRTAEYRFMGLAGDRTYGTAVRTDDFNHSVLIGLRYSFGAAPAPVEAAPMPVADMGAKTFLVFFDWDKADLTARSAAIVHDAAAYSTGTRYTRIDVDGNTDTSGTPGYNQGLSERRARVVAAELVRDGVPQSAISMHAYGDTKLLVSTGPGVREPQNRRVEIVFH
jgi:outer membrane protein OmpA-like peptidoglycan-associated protein